jgi:protein-tyrosine-phosphatase
MSAEYLMKKYLEDHNISDISVSSAGTTARPQPSFPETLARLQTYGCDATAHQQTKLSAEILSDKDVVICMAEHHRTVVREF